MTVGVRGGGGTPQERAEASAEVPHVAEGVYRGVLAELELISLGVRVVEARRRREVDPKPYRSLSYFQIGCRALRRTVWSGGVPELGIRSMPHGPWPPGAGGVAKCRAIYESQGIPCGQVWLPPDSFELRNAYWWLPGRHHPRPRDEWAVDGR